MRWPWNMHPPMRRKLPFSSVFRLKNQIRERLACEDYTPRIPGPKPGEFIKPRIRYKLKRYWVFHSPLHPEQRYVYK